jgi:ribosomal protein L11 methylase PrmA
MLPYLHRLVKPKGHLIWSGILSAEKNAAISAAKKKGFILIKDREEKEWWAGIFKKIS